jgi:thiamine pyrophosphokinase
VAAITIEDQDRGRWTLLGAGAAPSVLIVLGGAGFAPARLRSEAAGSAAIVAADAGAAFCLLAGLMPDVVVGDFDSLPAEARAKIPPDRLHASDDAETNDLEKALALVNARWGADVDVALAAGAGVGGGRSDHAIANLGPLLREPHPRLSLIDGEGRLIALRHGRALLEGFGGKKLSLLPWTLHGVSASEKGVRYPLDHAQLLLGGRGISNEITDESAVVEVHEGVALVWIEA